MRISFNLNELNELKDYPKQELSVALRVKNEFEVLLRNAQLLQSSDVVLIQQQIDFITEEINLLKEKERLLINIHIYLCESVRKNNSEVVDIVQMIKETEHI